MTDGTEIGDGAPFWERLPETTAAADFRQHRIELNRKLRAAFLAGAEEPSVAETGRGLKDEELQRVMQWYPGDLPIRPQAASAGPLASAFGPVGPDASQLEWPNLTMTARPA